jgi:hypothetical protein
MDAKFLHCQLCNTKFKIYQHEPTTRNLNNQVVQTQSAVEFVNNGQRRRAVTTKLSLKVK